MRLQDMLKRGRMLLSMVILQALVVGVSSWMSAGNTATSTRFSASPIVGGLDARRRVVVLQNSASDNDSGDEEPDLFDFFDPLLSPHAYPDGISPEHKPLENPNQQTIPPKAPSTFGIDYLSQKQTTNDIDDDQSTTTCKGRGNDGGSEEPDLFDYFDPLLSPHAYPNGVSPENKPLENPNQQTIPPKATSTFGIDYLSQKKNTNDIDGESKTKVEGTVSTNDHGEKEDLFDYFDPLLSPHAYPNGVSPNTKPKALEVVEESTTTGTPPEGITKEGSERLKIGVLLMDHGSRSEASNQRLQRMAELYQLTINDELIVVRAAHMEIASPSIPDGLKTLLLEGVDEIVCHPYFLSPGRHVKEDIPRIVEDAIERLEIDIPVITTDPIGSNTQLMIGAIHSLVRENSQVLRTRKQS